MTKLQKALNPKLPPATEVEIRNLLREVELATLLSRTDFGKMWKAYQKMGTQYEKAGFYDEAVAEGFDVACQIARTQLSGQHALRKLASSLLKKSDIEINYLFQLSKAEMDLAECVVAVESLKNDEAKVREFKLKLAKSKAELAYELGKKEEAVEIMKVACAESIQLGFPDLFLEFYRRLCGFYTDGRHFDEAFAYSCDIMETLLLNPVSNIALCASISEFVTSKLLRICAKFQEWLAILQRVSGAHSNWRIDFEIAKVYDYLLDFKSCRANLIKAKNSLGSLSVEQSDAIDYYIDSYTKSEPDLTPLVLASASKSDQGIRELVHKWLRYEEESINGEGAYCHQVITLNSMLKSMTLQDQFQLAKLYDLSGEYEKCLNLLETCYTGTEFRADSMAEVCFMIGNCLDSLDKPFESIESYYKKGLNTCQSADLVLKIKIYENLEFNALKHHKSQLATKYRMDLLTLRADAETIENDVVAVYHDPMEIHNQPVYVLNTEDEKHISHNVRKEVSVQVLNILIEGDERFPLNRLKETLIMNPVIMKKDLHWLKNRFHQIIREKYGITVYIERFTDSCGTLYNLSDTISGSIPFQGQQTNPTLIVIPSNFEVPDFKSLVDFHRITNAEKNVKEWCKALDKMSFEYDHVTIKYSVIDQNAAQTLGRILAVLHQSIKSVEIVNNIFLDSSESVLFDEWSLNGSVDVLCKSNINLSINNISSTVLCGLFSISSQNEQINSTLLTLNVSGNQFDQNCLQELGKLSCVAFNLQSITLDHTDFSAVTLDGWNYLLAAYNLQELHLRFCKFSFGLRTLIDLIVKQTKFSHLDVSYSTFAESDVHTNISFQNTTLTGLNVSEVQVGDLSAVCLPSLTSLSTLRMRNCNIDSLKHFSRNLNRLKTLDVSRNSQITPSDLSHNIQRLFSFAGELEYLNIDGIECNQEALEGILSGGKQLKSLNLTLSNCTNQELLHWIIKLKERLSLESLTVCLQSESSFVLSSITNVSIKSFNGVTYIRITV